MRRTTIFVVALSFVLATLCTPVAVNAAPARGATPAAQEASADSGPGSGFLARILDWLVDFATAPADDGGQPLTPDPPGRIPTQDPNGRS